MSDTIEHAKEGIEEAHHHGDSRARRIAVLIAVLAAGLALSEMGEKGAQNRISPITSRSATIGASSRPRTCGRRSARRRRGAA